MQAVHADALGDVNSYIAGAKQDRALSSYGSKASRAASGREGASSAGKKSDRCRKALGRPSRIEGMQTSAGGQQRPSPSF
jgi:hypothetical protein